MFSKIKSKISTCYHSILFHIVRRIILKHFRNSTSAINGRNGYNKPIAWSWTFEDEEYEKYKKLKK